MIKISKFPYPQWKQENPITYRKQQTKREITKLRQKMNRLLWGSGSKEEIERIKNKIDKLEKLYRKLQGS